MGLPKIDWMNKQLLAMKSFSMPCIRPTHESAITPGVPTKGEKLQAKGFNLKGQNFASFGNRLIFQNSSNDPKKEL